MEAPHPRVALVHDFLLDVRGAERVFEVLCEMFGDADLFTAVYDPVGTEGRFAHRNVHTTFLQKLRPTARTFRAFMPLYPAAIESLDLRGYDLVVSSSSAWAHGVIPDEDAVHLCYCHNPFRYAWNEREWTLERTPLLARPAMSAILKRWRQWDTVAAQRVDRYVANSEMTRRRVRRAFGRDSDVLPPPVDTTRFTPGRVGEDYVMVSELMPHKRLDVAVEAFSALRLPLLVVGKGPDLRRLKRLAGPTVRFAGHVPDREVERLLSSARAVVVTAREEFGIAAVEAQAAGRPVIALRDGGVVDTVIEGETGVFYDTSTPAALMGAVRGFDALAVDPAACVASSRRFDKSVFMEEFGRVVDEVLADGASSPPMTRRKPKPRLRGLARPAA